MYCLQHLLSCGPRGCIVCTSLCHGPRGCIVCSILAFFGSVSEELPQGPCTDLRCDGDIRPSGYCTPFVDVRLPCLSFCPISSPSQSWHTLYCSTKKDYLVYSRYHSKYTIKHSYMHTLIHTWVALYSYDGILVVWYLLHSKWLDPKQAPSCYLFQFCVPVRLSTLVVLGLNELNS